MAWQDPSPRRMVQPIHLRLVSGNIEIYNKGTGQHFLKTLHFYTCGAKNVQELVLFPETPRGGTWKCLGGLLLPGALPRSFLTKKNAFG